MNLFRLLILGFLGWWVYRVLQKWRIAVVPREQTVGADGRPDGRRGERQSGGPAGRLTRCEQCGVRVPATTLDPHGHCDRCRHA